MSSWCDVRVKEQRRTSARAALLAPLCALVVACSGESPGRFSDLDPPPPPRCEGVVCEPIDACHEPGTCDPDTGKCSVPAKAEGTPCTDGDACTTEDTCRGGTCQGVPHACAPLNDCHNPGLCNPRTGECTNPRKLDGSGCDDGDACTRLDACSSGLCRGEDPVECEAADACHEPGRCDPATGRCSSPEKPDGSRCDDGDGCSREDSCEGGVCRAGVPVECTAIDDCHNPGLCDPRTGQCEQRPKADGSACDDGNPCTTLDRCDSGSCAGGPALVCPANDACHESATCNPATGQCEAAPRPDGTACNDGNACTRVDTCQGGACTGAEPVVCAATDVCHLPGSCDIATGACSNPPKPNGSVCSDGNACTRTDTCQSGVCTGGNPVVCTSSDQCREGGTCNPQSGLCSGPAKPNGTACSDGNACTQSDSCQSGACAAGAPVTCSATDQCHIAGTCDPSTGQCSNPVKASGSACNDGNACTLTDTCQGGVCTGQNPVSCASTDPCRAGGTCNPVSGQCSSPAGPDGAFCTDARDCATGLAACSGGNCAAAGCFASDADRCTLHTVDPATGAAAIRARRCPPVYLDPDTGVPNHCLELDTTIGPQVDPACNPAQSSCPRTGCVPSTGVCEYRPRACGAAACDTHACTPSTGQCDTSSPVGCDALVPDTCHVVSPAVPGGCEATAGCVFEPVVCPAPPDGCSEYVQNPRPSGSTAPCCELADRCARLTDVTGIPHACVSGACVASQ